MQVALDSVVDLLANTELCELSRELKKLELNPLAFLLSPIWTSPKCDEKWGREKARQELEWAMPIMRETIGELREGNE